MYYSIDGDEVGKKLEYYLASDQVDKAIAYSSAVTDGVTRICTRLQLLGAEILFCGGDSILAESVNRLNFDVHSFVGDEITWSVGVGATPSTALLALKKAKALGRNQTVTL